jgi:hypothetical protein
MKNIILKRKNSTDGDDEILSSSNTKNLNSDNK